MSDFGKFSEEKIREAIESGEFSNLAGEGKPLKWEENPFEPAGWGMAFRVLKNNGFTLPWIEDGLEIDQERANAHRELAQAGASQPEARDRFAARVQAINKLILGYNLRVPSPVFQRRLLSYKTELAEVEAGRIFDPQSQE